MDSRGSGVSRHFHCSVENQLFQISTATQNVELIPVWRDQYHEATCLEQLTPHIPGRLWSILLNVSAHTCFRDQWSFKTGLLYNQLNLLTLFYIFFSFWTSIAYIPKTLVCFVSISDILRLQL